MERMLAAATDRAARRRPAERHVKREREVRRTSGRHADVSAADIETRLATKPVKGKGKHIEAG